MSPHNAAVEPVSNKAVFDDLVKLSQSLFEAKQAAESQRMRQRCSSAYNKISKAILEMIAHDLQQSNAQYQKLGDSIKESREKLVEIENRVKDFTKAADIMTKLIDYAIKLIPIL